jgi:hypothetical protein
VLVIASMKTIVLGSLLVAGAPAFATPVVATATDVRKSDTTLRDSEREEIAAFLALKSARLQVAAARSRWDFAVANGHPVSAGEWAKRHLVAMQERAAAQLRWQRASDRVNDLRFRGRR